MSRAANDAPFNYVVAKPWKEKPRLLNIYTYGSDVQQQGTMQQALRLLAYVKQRVPGEPWAIYRVDFTPTDGVTPSQAPSVSELMRLIRNAIWKDGEPIPSSAIDLDLWAEAEAYAARFASGVAIPLAGGWGELREGEHFTRHPAPDATAAIVPSPRVTLRMGGDGKLHPDGVLASDSQTKS